MVSQQMIVIKFITQSLPNFVSTDIISYTASGARNITLLFHSLQNNELI